MEDEVIFFFAMAFCIFIAGGVVVLYLWKSKSKTDQRAYANILQQPKVRTCYDPVEYDALRKKQ